MKVYTKKNNGLRLLGEGMVFSKGQLMLKEDDTLSLTPDEEDGKQSAPEVVKKGEEELNSIGKDASYTILPKDVNGGITKPQQSSSNGNPQTPIVTVDKTDPNIVNTVRTNVPIGNGVRIVDKQQVNSSVTSRKVMDEMRANSVPFTKTELTKFLKSI
jgi:hypothetical protein